MKLYNVFHKDYFDGSKEYECTTDNFKKWLEEHNSRRYCEGNEKEDADDFEVEEISLSLYNCPRIVPKSKYLDKSVKL